MRAKKYYSGMFRELLRYLRSHACVLSDSAFLTTHQSTHFPLQAIDIFMSSCLVFVFLSLIEYALVNIILGDIIDSEEALAKHAGAVRSSVFAHTSKLLYKNVSAAAKQ